MQWDLTVTYFIDVHVPYFIDVYVSRTYNGIQENAMGSNCNVFYRCVCSKKIRWDLTVTYFIHVYVPRKSMFMFQDNTMGSNCNVLYRCSCSVFYRCLCFKNIQWDLNVTYFIDVYVPRKYNGI